jgi:hypothetical protein
MALSKEEWAMIEELYRDPRIPVTSIAKSFGVSHTAINLRAKQYNWVRDPQEAVRQLAQQKLLDITHPANQPIESTVERVERAANAAAEVLAEHRRMAGAFHQILAVQTEELMRVQRLEQEAPGELEDRIADYYFLKAGGDAAKAKRMQQEMALAIGAVSLGARAKTLLNMASTFEKIVNIERKSHKMDKEEGETRTYEEVLAEAYQQGLARKRVIEGESRAA